MRKLVEKANEIRALPNLQSSDEDAWRTLARDYLVKTFGSRSPNVDAVLYASGDSGLYAGMNDYEYRQYLVSGFDNKIKQLNICIEQLETDISLQTSATGGETTSSPATPTSSRVFVVHGHNQGAKEAVARFLEKLGLEPIILHEKPNAGRTVIEKFSDYADVHFAVVLLTADDEGRSIAGSHELRPRARQNVILELGYFLGRLGRARVCALYEAGVEIPSDYSGVLFVQLDATGAWRFELVKELLAAGFAVDANRIFSAS
ncbi:TIR domain-containing protein [Kinneretia aquatilis]|uniref:TIR domain-containing protein n=1 Tax=Kinneretia aquatilis TaxID=2070761 RepID=UPI001CBEAF6B|nr:nucleotide-binding protein [Paucibacter aquatile]WIV97245.1 nucleotide-binding protein [Paucibacter aquatile]